MRSILLPVAALALAACGPTNVNQENYDAIKAEYEAKHGGGHGHGDGHGDDAAHGDGSADADHADKGDAAHADKGDAAHADKGDATADAGDAHGGDGHDLAAGKKVYETYCISCHGADGKGMNGLAANLAEDETRLAKDTDVLVKNIREGYQGKIGVMPPWGAVVSDTDARNVIAWLRSEYQDG